MLPKCDPQGAMCSGFGAGAWGRVPVVSGGFPWL